MMRNILHSYYLKKTTLILVTILLAIFISLSVANNAGAEPEALIEISGEGISNPMTLTHADLEDMKQYQQAYSVINAWPTKKVYIGKGVKLEELLQKAEIQLTAKLIKFTSQDGYTVSLTVAEVLKDKRYYFPHFKEDGSPDGDGVLDGSTRNAAAVEPIIAVVFVEGSDNPAYMNDLNAPMLMLGQRAVTEQTGNLLVKHLYKIEVLNSELSSWDKPQANPASGQVTKGTMVALSNNNMDDDKIYYTTDGTTPDLNSTIYNKIAKRWWSARADVLGVHNSPIGPINEKTVIKAITIGPGKKDSEVVTFTYEIEGTLPEPQDATAVTMKISDTNNHWAKANIEKLIATGSVSGYPDGTFKPDQTITRAEFASILCNVFKFESLGTKEFNDTKGHWAKNNIAKATAAGVVSGYDANTFGPNDLITREQMAVMVARTVNLPLVSEELGFNDSASISAWAKSAVVTVNKYGMMKGYQDNTVKPQNKASRAEAVTLIINALESKV